MQTATCTLIAYATDQKKILRISSIRFIFQFVIQATTGGGNEGDIAVDDVAVLDGECEYIVAQSMSDTFDCQ